MLSSHASGDDRRGRPLTDLARVRTRALIVAPVLSCVPHLASLLTLPATPITWSPTFISNKDKPAITRCAAWTNIP